jgi:hypothetical protein
VTPIADFAMPIRPYLADGERFDAETLRILGIAFEMARVALGDPNQDDLTHETIARQIIELAKTGERDADRLCDQALTRLGRPPPTFSGAAD